jgi:DNA-binding response OmpR family regulator
LTQVTPDQTDADTPDVTAARRTAGVCALHRGVLLVPIKTVLIAEDDPHIRRVAEIALRRSGFDVSAVTDGAEALQLLEDRLFDLVVLDGMMPHLDGLETCRQIKANPRTAHVPVIMLSARTQAADEQAGYDAGALGYLRKPFNALELGTRIRQLCAEGH